MYFHEILLRQCDVIQPSRDHHLSPISYLASLQRQSFPEIGEMKVC